MTITATCEQMSRVIRDWSEYAGETVKVEQVGGAMYAFGSELALLRLHYRMKSGRVEFSENLSTWFYCKD